MTTEKTVLAKGMGGGPMNLGDPDDRSLRKIEKNVLITNIMRDIAKKEKCVPEVQAFKKCSYDHQLTIGYYCREARDDLYNCLSKYLNSEDFRAECTEIYLSERSEYRRTGIPQRIYQR